ncbi:MAG: hypothetical protein ABS76_22000 [Pelagibacterium sp. SCN 64-44]|nr:MAG: hypothetical protein ABS76_22000 [Pelagibacterium sp. SCN 64-44]
MGSIHADLGVTALDTERAVLRAAVKRLPAWVRCDPCRRLARRTLYREMPRRHAQAQRGVSPTLH